MLFYLVIILSVVVNNVASGAIATSEMRDDLTDHQDGIVGEHVGDGVDILTRSIRIAKSAVCKYEKGEWSGCDKMLMVS